MKSLKKFKKSNVAKVVALGVLAVQASLGQAAIYDFNGMKIIENEVVNASSIVMGGGIDNVVLGDGGYLESNIDLTVKELKSIKDVSGIVFRDGKKLTITGSDSPNGVSYMRSSITGKIEYSPTHDTDKLVIESDSSTPEIEVKKGELVIQSGIFPAKEEDKASGKDYHKYDRARSTNDPFYVFKLGEDNGNGAKLTFLTPISFGGGYDDNVKSGVDSDLEIRGNNNTINIGSNDDGLLNLHMFIDGNVVKNENNEINDLTLLKGKETNITGESFSNLNDNGFIKPNGEHSIRDINATNTTINVNKSGVLYTPVFLGEGSEININGGEWNITNKSSVENVNLNKGSLYLIQNNEKILSPEHKTTTLNIEENLSGNGILVFNQLSQNGNKKYIITKEDPIDVIIEANDVIGDFTVDIRSYHHEHYDSGRELAKEEMNLPLIKTKQEMGEDAVFNLRDVEMHQGLTDKIEFDSGAFIYIASVEKQDENKTLALSVKRKWEEKDPNSLNGNGDLNKPTDPVQPTEPVKPVEPEKPKPLPQKDVISKISNLAISEVSASANVMVENNQRLNRFFILDQGEEDKVKVWTEGGKQELEFGSKDKFHRDFTTENTYAEIGVRSATNDNGISGGAVLTQVNSKSEFDNNRSKGKSKHHQLTAFVKKKTDNGIFVIGDLGVSTSQNEVNLVEGGHNAKFNRKSMTTGVNLGITKEVSGFDVTGMAGVHYNLLGGADYNLNGAEITQSNIGFMSYNVGGSVSKNIKVSDEVEIQPSASMTYYNGGKTLEDALKINGYAMNQKLVNGLNVEVGLGMKIKDAWTVKATAGMGKGSESAKTKNFGIRVGYEF